VTGSAGVPQRGHGSAEGGEGGGVLAWVGLAVGWAVVGFAVWGMLGDADLTNPRRLVWWVVGLAVAHDLVVAPVVLAAGIVLAKAPAWWGRPVGAAAAISAVVVLFSYPLLRRFGQRAANPTVLPYDYRWNVLIVCALVWLVTAGMVVVRMVGRRRTG